MKLFDYILCECVKVLKFDSVVIKCCFLCWWNDSLIFLIHMF